MNGLEQIIVAGISGLNTLALSVVGFLLRQQWRRGMSPEERDLLTEIRTEVVHIKEVQVQEREERRGELREERERRRELTRRLDEHLIRHP